MKLKLKMIWRILWAKRWFIMTEDSKGWRCEYKAVKDIPSIASADYYAELAISGHRTLSFKLIEAGQHIRHLGVPQYLRDCEEKNRPQLLYFYTTWAGPCKNMDDELKGKEVDADMLRFDIDKHLELAKQYAIYSIPTFVLKDHRGILLGVKKGFCKTEELNEWIGKLTNQIL